MSRVIFIFLAICLTSCEQISNEDLRGLSFPSDCSLDNPVTKSFISDDWEMVDEEGDFFFFQPNLYLLFSEAEGIQLFALSTRVIDTIQSWTITDENSNIVFSLENFPTNNVEYGWNGKFNGVNVQDGFFHSKAIFNSPNGIENFVEWTFCGFRCNFDLYR